MAVNPQAIDCPVGQWTLIVTDTTDSTLHVHPNFHAASYIYTYRVTGDPAPDSAARALEGIPIFDNQWSHPLASRYGEGIDCYVWCENSPGRVILYN